METEERLDLLRKINENPRTRQELASLVGQENVLDTEQLKDEYENFSFAAPFVYAQIKGTDKQEILCFQHTPRLYWRNRAVG